MAHKSAFPFANRTNSPISDDVASDSLLAANAVPETAMSFDTTDHQVVTNVTGNSSNATDLSSKTGDAIAVNTAASLTVAGGATVEIDGASAQSATFAGSTGTLVLNDAPAFTGQVLGLIGSDALDLADVSYGPNTTASFSGNVNGGLLTVTNGTETAQIALVGDYLKSGWTLSSDGHGGTVVVDPPLGSAYPNAATTGVSPGTNLTAATSNTISSPGVYSGLIFNGTVTITSSNVTLENCLIEGTPNDGFELAVVGNLSNVVIQNDEIAGTGTNTTQTGVYGIYIENDSQVTINAVNIHDVGVGVDVSAGQVVVENSYIHNFGSGSGTHYNGVAYFGGGGSDFSLLIKNNSIINQLTQTDAVILQNYFGPVNNVTVTNNLLYGGDYPIYVEGEYSGGAVTNVSITNNDLGLGPGSFGYTDFNSTNPTFVGNLDDGAALVANLNNGSTSSPAAPLISTGVENSNQSVTLTGTAADGSTVTVSDGGATALGTTTASSTGTWSFTTADLSAGSYTFTATDTTSAGTSAASSPFAVTVSSSAPPPPPPVNPLWYNQSFPTQTTTFTASFDATPSQLGSDIVIGLSPTTAGAYTDLAAIVRFNSSNTIDVRNGSAYGANVSVPYSAGTSYHFVMVVNLATDTYSVYVTPQGGSQIALATNYAFRTEQATDTSLSDVADYSVAGSAAVQNFSITSGPVISSLVESPSSGDLNAGKTVTLTLNMSEVVTVNTSGGTPTLTLNDGTTATYTGGSGTSALVFSYTVGAGQNTAALAATAINLNSATITDGAGNAANLSLTGLTQTGPQIDTTSSPAAPLISTGVENSNQSVTLTGTAADGSTVTVSDGGATALGTTTASSTGTWSFTTADLSAGSYTFTATDTTSAGTSAASSPFAVTVSSSAPPPPPPVNPLWYNQSFATQTTTFTASFDATPSQLGSDIVIGLSPTTAGAYTDLAAIVRFNSSNTIDVRNGSAYGANVSVPYSAGTSYHFVMVVNLATDTYSVYVTPQGGSQIALATNYAFRTEQATDTSLSDVADYSVAGSAAVQNFSITSGPVISSLVESPSSGDLNAGKTVTLTLNMSEVVTVNTSGGTPTLTLNDGTTATYTGGSGTSALVFSYTVGAGQNTAALAATAVNLNGATIKDGAGNAANLSLSGLTQTGPQIDTTTPVISAIGDVPTSGDLNAGKTVTYTITTSEAVTVTGTPQLMLNDGGIATYTAGSGYQRTDLQLHCAGRSEHARPAGVGDQSQRGHDQRWCWQCRQPVAEWHYPGQPADRHHGTGDIVCGRIPLERRPHRRQDGHADAGYERGGDGCRRHADAFPQRRRHGDLYGRLGLERADLQLHGGGWAEHGQLGSHRGQSQCGDHY